MIRTFGIPGDLPRLQALGLARPLPASASAIATRLDYLQDCVNNNKCPDLKGKRHVQMGRVSYELVPLPVDLQPHREDLDAAIRACQRLLDGNNLQAAREWLEGVEKLVEDMARRTDPDRRRGEKVVAGASKSGKNRRKNDTQEIIDYVENGNSYGQAAQKFHLTRDAVAKRVQRASEAVKGHRIAAEQGDADAQHNLGVMYEWGQGVPQDYVEAHKWVSLAAAQQKNYSKYRDSIAQKMTPQQIAEAQRLAREWKPKTWDELKGQLQD